MKQLNASVLAFNLDRIKQGLVRLGVGDITISEVRTIRRTESRESSETAASTADFLPRIRVRVIVPDDLADRAEEVLRDGV